MLSANGRNSEDLGIATEYDLYKIIRYVDVCTKFELLKVKEPIISARWV